MNEAEYHKKQIIKHQCENDLLFFSRYFFKNREGIKFIVNEHHKIISETLDAVREGKYKNVIFNVPPGSSKTEMVAINFIAQSLALNPRCRFIHISYSDDLVLLNSSKTKEIMLTDEYQELWPTELKQDQNTKKLWLTKQGGGMYSVALGGAITGFRAGHMEPGFTGAIIIDDPLKVEDSYSSVARDKANRAIISTVKSRKATPDTPIILIMQRLHEMDPTGFLLEGGTGDDWHHVKIPAILEYEGKEYSYWEYKEPIADLKKMEKADQYTFSGQYMQSPAPVGGGEFKKKHIHFYNNYDPNWTAEGMNVYILYDPANAKKKKSDWTAMVVVGLAPDNNYYILDLLRDKLNPTDRITALIDLHKKWNKKSGKPPIVGCEQYGMMTDAFYLRKAQAQLNYRFHVVEVKGSMSKEDRIRRLVPIWENDRVYLPEKILYNNYEGEEHELVTEFINDELTVFPVGHYDDMLDAFARITDDAMSAYFPQIEVVYLERGQSMKQAMGGDFAERDFMDW
jgi:predicted phage terminase large subunit-like protein